MTDPEKREEDISSWADKISAKTLPSFQQQDDSSQKPAPKVKTGNEKLAAQALELLVNMNDLLCGVLMIVGFNGTALAISMREEAFREQAYAALLLDPGLCRRLTEKAKVAGPMGLVVAYGMLAASVAPIAYTEYGDARARAAAKKQGNG